MNNIIALIQPFTINQEIMVYSDGEVVDTIKVPLKNFNEILNAKVLQYNVGMVNLVGNKSFTDKLKTEFVTDYAETNVRIEQIQR